MSEKNPPLFSIIVPVYNVESFITQTIESVLAQAFKNYELIIIDDGSTDKSSDICFLLAKQFSQITFIRQKNSGVSEARNLGITIAKGEYVMFLDGDDYWIGTKVLNDLAEIIKTKNMPDLILHTFSTINLQDEEESQRDLPMNIEGLSGNYLEDFSLLITRHIYRSSVWTKVIKREILIQNKILFPKDKRYEDSEWSFNLAKYIKSYAIYNSAFYLYQAGRIGSTTTFIPAKNIRDYIEIIYTELTALEGIKQHYFHLYQGLFNYISREIHFVIKFFNTLSNEEKITLLPKLTQCTELFNHYIRTEFSITR